MKPQPLCGRGAEGERGRMALGVRQMYTLEFGLHHLYTNCVILGKFLNLSEPLGQHPIAQGLPED